MRATPELGVARRVDDLLVENVKNDNSFQEAVRGCSSAMAINAPRHNGWIYGTRLGPKSQSNTSRHT
jgi:hypothetical protein